MSSVHVSHGDRAHVLHSGIVVTRNGSWLDRALMLRVYLPRLRERFTNGQTPKAT